MIIDKTFSCDNLSGNGQRIGYLDALRGFAMFLC